MGQSDEDDSEVSAELVLWIRKLRKGIGIQRDVAGIPFAHFGVSDKAEFVERLERACDRLPDGREKDAISNALDLRRITVTLTAGEPAFSLSLGRSTAWHPDWPARKLEERREEWCRKQEISLRTLIRLEDEGATMLAHSYQNLHVPPSARYILDLTLPLADLEERLTVLGAPLPDELRGPLLEHVRATIDNAIGVMP